MSQQLALDTHDRVTHTRVTVINDDTLEPGRTYTEKPCGCLTCCNRHDGTRWTHRHPHPHVFRYRHALYCPDCIDGRLAEARRARKGAATT